MSLPKKALPAQFALLATVCSTRFSFIDHVRSRLLSCNQLFGGPRSVLQANWSAINFMSLYALSYSWYLGPTGSDPGLFPQDSKQAYNYLGYPRFNPRWRRVQVYVTLFGAPNVQFWEKDLKTRKIMNKAFWPWWRLILLAEVLAYNKSALWRSASPAFSFVLFYTLSDVWLRQHLFN